MRSLNSLIWCVTAGVCLSAAVLVAGLFNDINAGEKKYSLEYKFKKGTGFGMTTTTERKSLREIMGNEIKTIKTDMVVYDAKVAQEKSETATIEVTYKERSHKTDDPQNQHNVDFSGLLGKTGQFTMTSRGKLSEFVGFDALPELVISSGQAHGENQYINELKEFFVQLPEDEIAVGETWSYTVVFDETVAGGGAKVIINYEYTLAEVTEKNGHDCLKLTGEYTANVKGGGVEQGMEFTITLDGKGSETAWFAYKIGMLLETEAASFLEGALVAEDVGFEMPIRNDYTSKRTVILK